MSLLTVITDKVYVTYINQIIMSEQCDGPIFTEVMFILIKVPKLVYRNFILL